MSVTPVRSADSSSKTHSRTLSTVSFMRGPGLPPIEQPDSANSAASISLRRLQSSPAQRHVGVNASPHHQNGSTFSPQTNAADHRRCFLNSSLDNDLSWTTDFLLSNSCFADA